MFTIATHDDGYVVTWGSQDAHHAHELRTELILEGLQCGREWADGLTVCHYRNTHETLHALIGIIDRLGVTYSLDAQVEAAEQAGASERALVEAVRSNADQVVPVDSGVIEFASGRLLLPYQQLAVARHLRMHNAADFSVPGAGKTTVALAYWALVRRENPDLGLWIIGPLSCFRPWEDELVACFGTQPDTLRIRGTPRERAQQLESAQAYNTVLCSYHTAWREEHAIIRALQARPWLLVLDEAHYVKSMYGALAASARALAPHANRRMVLTGTPMPRAPEDLWSLFTFLWPTEALLGNAQQHALRCKKTIEAACDELKPIVSSFFHRTCKSDLGLPAIESAYPVIEAQNVPASQRLILRLIEKRTLEELRYLNPTDQAHLRRWRRARLIRLLQAASNPLLLANALDPADIQSVLDDDVQSSDSADPDIVPLTDIDSSIAAILRRYEAEQELGAKLRHVAARVRELVQAGQKVVVWTVFLGNVDLLAQILEDLRPLCITGSVPAYDADDDDDAEATREQRIQIFKTDPSRRVLIANAAACSESISLHRACQYAIYLERSFNAAQFIQSLDRIHRQGMPPGTTAHIEIPSIPCAIERVLNRRLSDRQQRLFHLLDDPMPVVGFDDDVHQGPFDIEDLEDISSLFDEVIAEIRAEHDA